MPEPAASNAVGRRIIVGTAGHIDHGKTTLVQALTGIDCDRWEEEKERGITIDLGFAHLTDGELQLGFVDVPGHERFVHNALAGLGGIDLMMLVVAADEGIMPQTREHLAICSLLEIPAALVALTKIDLVDPEIGELAELELTEALAGTPFADCPIRRVSSKSGEGIAELRRTLLELARATPERTARRRAPTRLPIDRAFHLRGLGVLATGTLAAGKVCPQDRLQLLPSNREVRVRSVQVHGEDREWAEAGERTALQLTGAALEEVTRGCQLIEPGAYDTTVNLLVDVRLLEDVPETFKGFREVRFHLYSSEVLGKLRPLEPRTLAAGGRAFAEVRLRSPVVAARGDRFVLRRPSPQATLGGGEILDPHWGRWRGRRLDAAISGLAGDAEQAVRFWVEAAGEAGVEVEALARRLGRPRSGAEHLLAEASRDGAVLEIPTASGSTSRWIPVSAYSRLIDRAERVLQRYFERDRLAKGMPKAEAVRSIFPPAAAPLADTYLEWLEKRGVLVRRGEVLDLPERGDQLTQEETGLAAAIVAAFDAAGLTPPSPEEICRELGAKPQIFQGVLRYLHQSKRLARLPQGLFISQGQLDRLATELRSTGWRTFSVGEFKDRFALTRKWAIPLLEYLDRAGQTRRVGDRREVLGK